ncbi:LacI family DNA-binding transcriptional regulator [Pedobacter insulae]|uniref:Transcriptional regulator, LacI family n=1 Tax=Pedobacter insulae TaxID=414048 RepID=A0A1I2ZMR1_9SPHI|nr:LacI family DNA-binding transcriptional regulator [Pedobacter insulae]SFH38906.1 transcriptional regulator, LacI family [Pedobacter insulae]
MKKTLSIKDIALEAGVSITTVSFILNGKAKEKAISDFVTKKVEKIIEDSGYKPNQLARSLRTGNSNIIGLIVEDISNPFFAAIAKMIEYKAYKKGYKIIYSSTENEVAKAQDLINMFKSRKVDAYIISPIKGIEDDIKALINDHKTVVLFDRDLAGLNIDYVGVDHFKASCDATLALVEGGRKNIALVTIDLDVKQITDRQAGYREVLEKHKLFKEELILKIPFSQSEAETEQQMKELFSQNKVDAVLFATNYLAISGLMVLRTLAVKRDKDFEVIAYDDHIVFELLTPQVSAVQQPLEAIADKIIDLVLSRLSTKEKKLPQQVIFPAKLILRKNT